MSTRRPLLVAGAALARRLTCLAAVLLMLPACGRKTPVRPPELTRPTAIQDLSAENTVDGIQLVWRRPEKAEDGSHLTDLAGFRVERSRGDGPFELLTTLDVRDRDRFRQLRHFRYHDQAVMTGERYRYRIISFTLAGDASAASNVAELVSAPPPSPTPARTP